MNNKKTIEELRKEYNDFVDSLKIGNLHLSKEDISVLKMQEKRDWLKTIEKNIQKLERRFDKVYMAHTIELEHYVRNLKENQNEY